MGCDIHMVLEGKRPHWTTNKWTGLSSYPYLDSMAQRPTIPFQGCGCSTEQRSIIPGVQFRDYALFTELASVRGESITGRTPLGVPKDVSELANYMIEDWASDGHSHSYLSLNDFVDCYEFTQDTLEIRTYNKLHNIKENREQHVSYCTGGYDVDGFDLDNDVRIVFWFDN